MKGAGTEKIDSRKNVKNKQCSTVSQEICVEYTLY